MPLWRAVPDWGSEGCEVGLAGNRRFLLNTSPQTCLGSHRHSPCFAVLTGRPWGWGVCGVAVPQPQCLWGAVSPALDRGHGLQRPWRRWALAPLQPRWFLLSFLSTKSREHRAGLWTRALRGCSAPPAQCLPVPGICSSTGDQAELSSKACYCFRRLQRSCWVNFLKTIQFLKSPWELVPACKNWIAGGSDEAGLAAFWVVSVPALLLLLSYREI